MDEHNAPRIPDASTAVDLARYDAVLFDLDGVLTSTATLRTARRKTVLDPEEHGAALVVADPREMLA